MVCLRHTVSDGPAVAPFKEEALYPQSLGCPFFNLMYLRRPGQLCIESHLKIPSCIDPLEWLRKDLCSRYSEFNVHGTVHR